MNLSDVKMGGYYRCAPRGELPCEVQIVGVRYDDGACLIGEIQEDGDCSGRLVMTEACELSEGI